jgi:hypothetical protein
MIAGVDGLSVRGGTKQLQSDSKAGSAHAASFMAIASAEAFDTSADGARGSLPVLQRRQAAVRAALTEAL